MAAIVVRDGPHARERIELGDGETLLGRASSEFLSHDEEVSRRHASLRGTAGGVEIEDLGSANGTFVNDRRIEGPTSLSSGDVVRLGRTSLEVEIVVEERATVIREASPPPVATPPSETLPQPPVEAPPGPPAFTPPPAVAQPPPIPAAPPYAAASAAGGAGMGVAAALVLFLAALIGLIWAIWELLRLLDAASILPGWFFTVVLASLIVVLVAVVLDVPGGIAFLRGRPSGRLLAALGGAAGILGPVVFVVTILSQVDAGALGGFRWLGLSVTAVAHAAALILGLLAGSRLVGRY